MNTLSKELRIIIADGRAYLAEKVKADERKAEQDARAREALIAETWERVYALAYELLPRCTHPYINAVHGNEPANLTGRLHVSIDVPGLESISVELNVAGSCLSSGPQGFGPYRVWNHIECASMYPGQCFPSREQAKLYPAMLQPYAPAPNTSRPFHTHDLAVALAVAEEAADARLVAQATADEKNAEWRERVEGYWAGQEAAEAEYQEESARLAEGRAVRAGAMQPWMANLCDAFAAAVNEIAGGVPFDRDEAPF